MEQKIANAIQKEPLLNGSPIVIEVVSGEIVLTGSVDHYAKKAIVNRTIKDLNLHMEITNNVSVKPDSLAPVDDVEIVSMVNATLERNLGDASRNVVAVCADGKVALSGSVKWNYQRQLAVECISEIKGITEIINNISAMTISEDIILKKNIVSALKLVFPYNISVDVHGDGVILHGVVKIRKHIADIEQLVQSIAHNHNVSNHITIETN